MQKKNIDVEKPAGRAKKNFHSTNTLFAALFLVIKIHLEAETTVLVYQCRPTNICLFVLFCSDLKNTCFGACIVLIHYKSAC